MSPNELVVWILGAVFAALLAAVGVILQQGRDTNRKVTEHGETLGALKALASEVGRIDRRVEQIDGKVDALAIEMANLRGANTAVTEIVKAFADAFKPSKDRRRSDP